MIFNMSQSYLIEKQAIHTASEIAQQPATWVKTLKQVEENWAYLSSFIRRVTEKKGNIILTGAGSSEYVGNSLVAKLAAQNDFRVFSVASTDLLTQPELFIAPDRPSLLISFARSGNSPESIGAVKAVEKVSDQVYHLAITCNKDGALAKMQGLERFASLILSDEIHDISFAMTSSFTNMYLAALILLRGQNIDSVRKNVETAITNAERFIDESYKIIQTIVAQFDFNRIVYLGSNNLKGIAQESGLKILELTAGSTASLFDTFLGFRHGPKSFVTPSTLIVMYLNNNIKVRKYELDLLREMKAQTDSGKILAVDCYDDPEVSALCDWQIVFDEEHLDSAWLALNYIMVAQTISLFKSLKTTITPDNPCPGGSVNRVVQGVTLYTED